MAEYDLRALQLKTLTMLKDFAKFCDENGITFFIAFGTLLGAVRHEGFIPWDDDVDVAMDIDNYKKLLKAVKSLPEPYYFQTIFNDKEYPCVWAKIRINGTTSCERELAGMSHHKGICMDVFVLSERSKYRIIESVQKKSLDAARFLAKKHLVICTAGDDAGARKSVLLYKFFPDFIRIPLIKLLMFFTRKKLTDKGLCFIETTKFNKNIHSHHFIKKDDNLIDVKFEDTYFKAINTYDELLSEIYGDWRALPPEEERIGHGDIIVDLDKDWTYYRDKALKGELN